MLEEKEFDEQDLSKLIDKVEKDPIPTNIMTNEPDDPLVLLGKMNEIEANLKGIRNLSTDTKTIAQDAQDKATEAITIAEDSNTKAETSINTSNTALGVANNALNNSNEAKTIATGASTTAGEAKTIATSANTTAGEAKTIAQNALEQVTEGLGTKVSRGTQLLNEYDIKPLEDKATANQTEIHALQDITDSLHEDITAVENRVTTNESDIVNITEMLSNVEEAVDTTLPNQIKDKMPVVIDAGGTTNPLYMNDLENGLYLIKNCGIIYFKQNIYNGVNTNGDCLLYLYNAEYAGTSKRKFFAITASTFNTDVIIQYGVADEPSNTYDIHRFNPQDFTARYIEVSTFKATSINDFNADTIVSNAINALTVQSRGNNYIKFKNGIIIQWGYLSAVTNDTITLPTPFTTTNYSVVGSTRYDADTGSRLIVCKFSHLTTTTFQITCSTQYGSDTQFRQSDAMWIAIGK